jgi:hypothetical protein
MTAPLQTMPKFKQQVLKTQAAMDRADRAALIEHAKLGYSVPEWDGTRVVHITPAEIFARYGLDEFGREKQPTNQVTES